MSEQYGFLGPVAFEGATLYLMPILCVSFIAFIAGTINYMRFKLQGRFPYSALNPGIIVQSLFGLVGGALAVTRTIYMSKPCNIYGGILVGSFAPLCIVYFVRVFNLYISLRLSTYLVIEKKMDFLKANRGFRFIIKRRWLLAYATRPPLVMLSIVIFLLPVLIYATYFAINDNRYERDVFPANDEVSRVFVNTCGDVEYAAVYCGLFVLLIMVAIGFGQVFWSTDVFGLKHEHFVTLILLTFSFIALVIDNVYTRTNGSIYLPGSSTQSVEVFSLVYMLSILIMITFSFFYPMRHLEREDDKQKHDIEDSGLTKGAHEINDMTPDQKVAFSLYLGLELCAENFVYHQRAIETLALFREATPAQEAKDQITTLYEDFISTKAAAQINIRADMRLRFQRVCRQLNGLDVDFKGSDPKVRSQGRFVRRMSARRKSSVLEVSNRSSIRRTSADNQHATGSTKIAMTGKTSEDGEQDDDPRRRISDGSTSGVPVHDIFNSTYDESPESSRRTHVRSKSRTRPDSVYAVARQSIHRKSHVENETDNRSSIVVDMNKGSRMRHPSKLNVESYSSVRGAPKAYRRGSLSNVQHAGTDERDTTSLEELEMLSNDLIEPEFVKESITVLEYTIIEVSKLMKPSFRRFKSSPRYIEEKQKIDEQRTFEAVASSATPGPKRSRAMSKSSKSTHSDDINLDMSAARKKIAGFSKSEEKTTTRSSSQASMIEDVAPTSQTDSVHSQQRDGEDANGDSTSVSGRQPPGVRAAKSRRTQDVGENKQDSDMYTKVNHALPDRENNNNGSKTSVKHGANNNDDAYATMDAEEKEEAQYESIKGSDNTPYASVRGAKGAGLQSESPYTRVPGDDDKESESPYTSVKEDFDNPYASVEAASVTEDALEKKRHSLYASVDSLPDVALGNDSETIEEYELAL